MNLLSQSMLAVTSDVCSMLLNHQHWACCRVAQGVAEPLTVPPVAKEQVEAKDAEGQDQLLLAVCRLQHQPQSHLQHGIQRQYLPYDVRTNPGGLKERTLPCNKHVPSWQGPPTHWHVQPRWPASYAAPDGWRGGF